MKPFDDEVWQAQRAELRADGESGQRFLEFVESWTSRAEALIDDEKIAMSPHEAIRLAFAPVENELGQVPAFHLGQMLVVIATHWTHGEDMVSGFSPIELRLLQDTLAAKVAELQKQAGQEGQEGDDDGSR